MTKRNGPVRFADAGERHAAQTPAMSPAEMCALAWVRSNFPAKGGPEILSVDKDGRKIAVTLKDHLEVVEFTFPTDLGASRAMKELSQQGHCILQPPHSLLGGINPEDLSAEMNGGGDTPARLLLA